MGVEQGLTIDNTLFFSMTTICNTCSLGRQTARNQTIAVRIGKLKHGKELAGGQG